MTDTPTGDSSVATPIEVAKQVIATRAKAQLRVALAAFAGMLIGKHVLPAGMLDDTLLDAIAALLAAGIAAYWQDVRVRLQHSRLWKLAIDKRVPDDLVRPKPEAAK